MKPQASYWGLLLLLLGLGCKNLEVPDCQGRTDWPETAGIDAAKSQELATAICQTLQAKELLGLQVSIVDATGETWTLVTGSRDLDRQQPLQATDLLRIGSVSKLYTAAVILRLAETDALSLNQAVGEFLPEYPTAAEVTLSQLLNHSSGIADMFSLPDVFIAASNFPDKAWDHRALIDACLQPGLAYAPGSQTSYSSTNYLLLALVAEQATGKPMATLYREYLSDPLGLPDLAFVPYEAAPPELVDGYVHHFALSMREWYRHQPAHTAWSTAAHASGALVTHSESLARFAHALFAGELLMPESKTAMLNFQRGKGLGPQEIVLNGRTFWGHEGEITGFEAVAAHDPQTGLTYAICANTTPFRIYDLLDELATLMQ